MVVPLVKLRHGVLLAALMIGPLHLSADDTGLNWRQLPPLPDPHGFAAPFVGVSNGAVLLAGGANFPDRQLWNGGRKVWHDSVFVLERNAAAWRTGGRLPLPLGYGVAVTTENGVLCAGGGNATAHHAEVMLLHWNSQTLEITSLPSLPQPIAFATGARAGNIVYVAGGLSSPDATEELATFYSLDLDNPDAGWTELSSWPGPGRSQAVAAVVGDAFYLLSGLRHDVVDGERRLVYLRDAYRYSPDTGWVRLPDLPYPAAAAATPAPTANGDILVIGGVDGSGMGKRPLEFYPASQRIQKFLTAENRWIDAGNAPVGRVCVTTTLQDDAWILPSGERSAGVRSPEVWSVVLGDD